MSVKNSDHSILINYIGAFHDRDAAVVVVLLKLRQSGSEAGTTEVSGGGD
jgi:hypothetical protein